MKAIILSLGLTIFFGFVVWRLQERAAKIPKSSGWYDLLGFLTVVTFVLSVGNGVVFLIILFRAMYCWAMV